MSDVEQTMEYQDLSKIAVLAITCAVLGCISFFVPMLTFLSFIGVLLAVVAIRNISRSDGALAGGRLANIALVLSVLAIGNTVGHSFIMSTRLISEARKNSEAWFQIVSDGKQMVAHQLMVPVEERVPRGVRLETHYASSSSTMMTRQDEMDSAFEDADVKRLVDSLVAGEKPEFRRAMGTKSSGNFYYVDLEYYFPEQDNEILITMRREFDPQSKGTYWQFWKARWKQDDY